MFNSAVEDTLILVIPKKSRAKYAEKPGSYQEEEEVVLKVSINVRL